MRRKRVTTVRDILRLDDVRGLLADISEQVESIEAMVVVIRTTNGELELMQSTSDAEGLGLLEYGKALYLHVDSEG